MPEPTNLTLEKLRAFAKYVRSYAEFGIEIKKSSFAGEGPRWRGRDGSAKKEEWRRG